MTRTRLHYTEYQPTEPQFIEPLDTDEYEKETKELLSQVPSQHHEYLDIFRKKGGTETLPPPRPYDMRIDLLPSAKLAVAMLYQLTEDQRMILLDTLKRETEAGRIRVTVGSFSIAKRLRERITSSGRVPFFGRESILDDLSCPNARET